MPKIPDKEAPPKKPKRGKKSTNLKTIQDKKLEELYYEDGITPKMASKIVGCGYKYALTKFNSLGAIIAEAEDEDWIERNERVRKRALEGLSVKLQDAKDHIKFVNSQLDQNKMMQEAALGDAVDKLGESPLGEMLKEIFEKIDKKVLFIVVGMLRKELDIHRSYGFLVAQLIREMRSERVFVAEMQQQFDAIEILPPPKAVLDAEIERHIAAKQSMLQPALPIQVKPKEK